MSAVEFLKGVLIEGVDVDIEQFATTAKCGYAISVTFLRFFCLIGEGNFTEVTVKQRPIFSTQQRPKLSSSAAHFRLFFPLLEPEGVIPGFQYVAVMGDAIE